MGDFILTFITIVEQIFCGARAAVLGFRGAEGRDAGGMTAAAAAALLDRGGLSVDAASAAAPVVGRQWGSPTVRYIQWLQEEPPLNTRTAAHTSESHREHVAFPLTS